MSNKTNKLKNINKPSFIQILQRKIVELVNEKELLSKEKLDLESSIRYYRTLEEKIKKLREKNKEMQNKYDELSLEKEKALKEMKLKYEKIIHEKEYELEKYQTNITIYNQKLNLIRHIEMENNIYKNEIKELKEKNEELIKTTKNKLDDYEIQNKIKYNHLKMNMIEHLKEAKNKVTQLNLNYMDTNSHISVLQNEQLLQHLESVIAQCDNYKSINEELHQQIKNLKNEIAMHKKIEINLTLKLRDKNDKIIQNKSLPNNYKYNDNISLTNYNNENKSNTFSRDQILNNSNIESKSIQNLKTRIINKNKVNNLKLLISHSLNSSDNETENYFLKNNKDFNYKKYKNKLKEKDEKIELLELQVDKLNNKLDNYFTKYKGLFNFLEYCLNEFYNDEKLMNINSSIKIENIKKFEFSAFNKQEQYSILIILMNYLMNIFAFNYKEKNTESDPPFFATNLKYLNNNFKITKNSFNHLFINNPFSFRNNKILKTFNSYRMNNNKMNFSISALNDNSATNDFRISDDKYKILI